MGVRERRREKKKEKEAEKVVDQSESSSIAESPHTPVTVESDAHEEILQTAEVSHVEVEAKESVAEPSTQTTVQEVLLPKWGTAEESEWMYHIPKSEKERRLWAEEWSDFLLEWMKSEGLHVLSLSMIIDEDPFCDILGKIDAFRLFGEVLIEKEVAEWLDKKQKQLRVYWRPLEEWADLMYQWALKTGNRRLDVKSLVIQETQEEFATLPEADLHEVLSLMVRDNAAEWVDKKKGAIRILV
ncbi:MAG: hypothetical protein JSW61_14615 [Candidatus Thorarchaeota archaeon]|nr:MAG: hypothetical protein JSW61_14615 [Candidatus Thorarchaeota archaeon]